MAKTKIVVLDGYTENPGDLSWDGLSALGDVTVYDRKKRNDPPILRGIWQEESSALLNLYCANILT